MKIKTIEIREYTDLTDSEMSEVVVDLRRAGCELTTVTVSPGHGHVVGTKKTETEV